MRGSTVRLAQAERLLSGEVDLEGAWPRCCAWLLRLAVEHAVREFWSAHDATALNSCRMRTQLIVLSDCADPTTAHGVADLWYALSRVAHYRDHELSPSAAELRDWHRSASEMCERLETHEHQNSAQSRLSTSARTVPGSGRRDGDGLS